MTKSVKNAAKTTQAQGRPLGRVFAYLRVSTDEQELDSQKLGVLDYAKKRDLQPLKFVSEKISGSVPASERTLGKELLPNLQQGDVLIVAEISRLGRSVVDILSTLKLLAEKGVSVHVVKGNMQLDESLNSKILTTVLGLTAEIERELIRQRTKEGQARAKAAGKHIGRPRLTDDSQRRSKLDVRADDIKKLAAKGVTKLNLARVFDCDWITMSSWLQRHGVNVKRAQV